MIPPTIGRVLLYHGKLFKPGDQPQVALVAFVHDDRLVNIGLFDAHGVPVMAPPQKVILVQPGDPIPEKKPYCTWMPYQIGQSQKTEELSKKVEQLEDSVTKPESKTPEPAGSHAHDKKKHG